MNHYYSLGGQEAEEAHSGEQRRRRHTVEAKRLRREEAHDREQKVEEAWEAEVGA